MWAIKILNGPQAGRIHQLELGTHTLGRSAQVSIRLASNSVSKVHAQLLVTEDKLILSDCQSSNGVFVNGIKVKNYVLKSGDKFSLSDIILDVILLPANVALVSDIQRQAMALRQANQESLVPTTQTQVTNYSFDGTGALATAEGNTELAPNQSQENLTVAEKADRYIDEVALPAVYKLSDRYDLKYVVAAFVVIFVILVTTLTVLPVVQISRDFIVDESRRRAEALARLVVQQNREFLLTKNEVNVSVASVRKEPGVDKAFIIAASDGHIIAPLNQRGNYSKLTFLQAARRKASKYHKVMESQIGVSLPILQHNPTTGEPTAIAYAVIIYSMDKVALDFERALGLIIQILIITIVAGGVLYFFLYRIISRPLLQLNRQLDVALKNSEQNIEMESPTPAVQRLISNINSALSRMSASDGDEPMVSMGDKATEAAELVDMFPMPALAISAETEMVIAANDYFEGHPLFDDGQLIDKYIEDLNDPSLQASLKDLLAKAQGNPNNKHVNNLPSQGGQKFEISIKAIANTNEVSYFLLSFLEIDDEEFDE